MIVPGRKESSELVSDKVSLDRTLPTVIFCNPNAGSYEYMANQSEYLNYYVNNGVNVVLWNYRGFGRSPRGFCGLLGM